MSNVQRFLFSTILTILFMLTGLFFVSSGAFGQDNLRNELQGQTDAFSGSQGANVENVESPQVIAARVINVTLGAIGMLMVVYMLYGGFLIMTSGGSEEKISEGRKHIFNATIGAAIIMSAWAITWFIFRSLGSASLGGQCIKTGRCDTTLTSEQCPSGSFCDTSIPACVAQACKTNDDCQSGFVCQGVGGNGNQGRVWRFRLN